MQKTVHHIITCEMPKPSILSLLVCLHFLLDTQCPAILKLIRRVYRAVNLAYLTRPLGVDR